MSHNFVLFDRCRAAFRGLAFWCALWLVGAAAAAAEPPARRPAPAAARSRTVVDHAVVPAGGMHCQHCGPAACPPQRGHVAECRDGMCAPHCPVRPSQYGYYKTQWRRWPGQDVVPVSAEEAATPAAPPKAQVPSVDEESPQAPANEPLLPDAGGDASAASPAADRGAPADATEQGVLKTEPIPEQPLEQELPPADRGERPSEQRPPAREAPVPPTPPVPEGGDDLFDTSARPAADAPAAAEPGRMRVPAPVGRSLATGAEPWRLEPTRRQRPADSARGL